jgi:hypothetical protein
MATAPCTVKGAYKGWATHPKWTRPPCAEKRRPESTGWYTRPKTVSPEECSAVLRWYCDVAAILAPGPAVPCERDEQRRAASERSFHDLARRWREDTETMSSIEDMALHPAYQRIIGMGPAALPLILRELERAPDHWFWALRAITGADPVEPEQRGDIKRMAAVWLAWARREGL